MTYFLTEGDTLTLYISDEFFKGEKSHSAPEASFTPTVIYEDAHILLLYKKAGVLVHPDENVKLKDTLVGALLSYLYQNGAYRPQSEQSFTPALCNRLDRNTSGIVIAAKDAPSLRVLNELMKKNLIDKKYWCKMEGKLSPPSSRLTGYITKNKTSPALLPHARKGQKR